MPYIIVCFTFRIMFFCYAVSFKGKEIDVTIVLRAHIKGNDETP